MVNLRCIDADVVNVDVTFARDAHHDVVAVQDLDNTEVVGC